MSSFIPSLTRVAPLYAFHVPCAVPTRLQSRGTKKGLGRTGHVLTKRRVKSFVARAGGPVPLASVASSTPSNALNRISAGIAGAALAIALSNASIFSPHHHDVAHFVVASAFAETETATKFSVSSLSGEERKALREESRRHTRAAGKVAQNFALARRQALAGDIPEALSTYDTITKSDPDFAPAYSNRGNIFAAQKKFDQAITEYDRSLELAPLDNDSWVVFVNRGVTKLARGDDPYIALADLNIANELRAGNDIILSNRAGVWEVMGKWDNAIRDYQAALQSNDVQPFWERYGLVLFQRNKSNEALSILKRVATRFDVSDVHAAMAVIYFDKGDIAEAETQWSLVDRPRLFESKKFLVSERKWPPRAVEAMENFRNVKE